MTVSGITLIMLAALASAAQASDRPDARTDHQGHRAIDSSVILPQADPQPTEGGDTSDWRSLGPFGGDIADVAVSPVNPMIVLAGHVPSTGIGGTLYRSTDGGNTWSTVAGFVNTNVHDIEFAPDGIAYLATGNGVRKSTTNGASWTQLNLSIGNFQIVFEVAIDPGNTDRIYAGIADGLGGQPINLIRSLNAGQTWSNITPPLSAPLTCRAIAVDPGDSGTIVAGFGGSFGGGQIWVSTDDAETWVNRSAGLPATPINDLVFDNARLLAGGGLLFGTQNFGLYASDKLGVNWTPLHNASWPMLVINDVALSPDGTTLHVASPGAGLFRSTDNGKSWEFGVGNSGGTSVNSVRHAPGENARLFAGASSIGILRSTNGGDDFTQASIGIGALNVESIAVNPLDTRELAIAFSGLNDGGVFTSTDAGTSWSRQALPGTRFNFVTFSPLGVLHTISDGPTSVAPEGVYRRDANGLWENLGPDQGPLFESELQTIEFRTADPNIILAGGSDFGVAGNEATIWRSPDAGQTWNKEYEGDINFEDVTDIKFVRDAVESTVVATFVGFADPQNGGVLRSTNTGLTWNPAGNNLIMGTQADALARVTEAPGSFYLADSGFNAGGLFKTNNTGLTFQATAFTGRIADVVTDPQDADPIFILQRDAVRVQASFDGGNTFAPFNTGLQVAGSAVDLEFAAGMCPNLYLATTTGTYVTALSPAPTGDADTDGDVDTFDFSDFNACMENPDNELCCAFDFNGDSQINWSDFGTFQTLFTGSL